MSVGLSSSSSSEFKTGYLGFISLMNFLFFFSSSDNSLISKIAFKGSTDLGVIFLISLFGYQLSAYPFGTVE
jgi:hypothetical protein